MKIGILSDTHGWLDPAILPWFSEVALILHAGDVGDEAVLLALREIAPTVAVRGNVDGGRWASELPIDYVATHAGKRIAMRHIAGKPGSPTPEARALIEREQPDVFICGHSHVLVAGRYEGALWLNPGALGRHGFHLRRTAFLLTIPPDGRMTLDKVDLGARGKGS